MNFLKRLFGGDAEAGGREGVRTVILDAERFVEGRGSPGERASALKRLAQFAAREKIRLTAVFAGRPLREVAEDDTFEGVRVFFCERAEDIGARVRKLAQDAGSGSCLAIVADRQLDKELADAGFRTMRVSTLKKAFEAEASGEDRQGGEGGGEGRRTMRRPRMDRRDGRRDRRGDRGDRGRDASAPRAPEALDESAPADFDGEQPAAAEPAPVESDRAPTGGESEPAAETAPERAPAPRPPPNAAVKSLIDLVE
jgi:hypothetical protein